MSERKRIIELHELHGSIRQVSKQLGTSRKTMKKYLERVQNVKQGVWRMLDYHPTRVVFL